ncbi:unnamed protein product, partial [Discosporangium mesarthrocarpum]
DFGIKYNCENGGPAPEKVTDMIFDLTKSITTYKTCPSFPDMDLAGVGTSVVASDDGFTSVVVEVISTTEAHVSLLKTIFDFGAIKALLERSDFTMVYDSMHGVQGPYAKAVFVDELGADPSCLTNFTPKDDFNGGHADPNLTYAKELVATMGLDNKGKPLPDASRGCGESG